MFSSFLEKGENSLLVKDMSANDRSDVSLQHWAVAPQLELEKMTFFDGSFVARASNDSGS